MGGWLGGKLLVGGGWLLVGGRLLLVGGWLLLVGDCCWWVVVVGLWLIQQQQKQLHRVKVPQRMTHTLF